MGMGKIGNVIQGLKPPMLMVVAQVILAGVNVMYKLAANDGMSLRIIVTYRFMFGAVVMLFLTLLLERESLGKINRLVLFQSFLCGLFGGSLGQNLYLQSLVYTSATFASALLNLIPAITFVLAILLKLEKLGIGTMAGKAKAVGTLVGIGGAMLFTFYKGPEINLWSTHLNLLHHPHQPPTHSSHDTGKFILGAFLGLCSCFSLSSWLIVQAKMSAHFPYLCANTALMCIMGSIQTAVISLCTVRDWSQWKLGWNVRLLAVSFTGIMGSAFMIFLVTWAVRLRGPLYVSIFNPLALVFVAIVGSLMLHEKLHLGSILGGIVIVVGLYLVLWGKAKEMKQNTQLVPTACEHDDEETKGNDQIENKDLV